MENLSLTHRAFITSALQKLNCEASEYNFNNLFLFRRHHQYQLIQTPHPFIRGLSRDQRYFLIPLFPLHECPTSDLIAYLKTAEYYYPLAEESIKSLDPSIFHSSYSKDDSDYLFHVSKIQNYPGRHLDGQRGQLKYLHQHFSVRSQPIQTDEDIQIALKLLTEWQKNSPFSYQATDYFACEEGLKLFHELSLEGQIAYINDTPAGFLLGEPFNKNTYLIHFAKGITAMRGIYSYLYQSLAQRLSTIYEWINMEQDLGLASLRKAKKAYLPDRMVIKLRLTSKNYFSPPSHRDH